MEVRRSARIRSKRTVPVTPELQTRKRARQYEIESHQDREDQEVAEMKAFKFKAKPAPNFVFDSEPVGIPQKKKARVTKAQTPVALRRTRKTRVNAKRKKTDKPLKRFQAMPPPDFKKVFEVAKEQCKVTKIKPFSFDKKYDAPQEVKQKLLEKTVEEEKKKREFKATPLYEMPGFAVDFSMSKSCTRVEPFNISKPNAYEEKLSNQAKRLEKENEELRRKREFKATYPYAIFEQPFVPQKDSTYVVSDDFNLHSEKRGVERKKFDISIKEQKVLKEKQLAAEESDKKEREKKEVAELRKKQVHKANPIGEFKKQSYHDIK